MLPKVQVQAPTTGFIIGRSRVGENLSNEEDTVEWIDLLDDATGLHIRRGGTAASGLNNVDTGTLTLTLFDRKRAKMLEDDERIRPNRPIRVITDTKRVDPRYWSMSNPNVPAIGSSSAFESNAVPDEDQVTFIATGISLLYSNSNSLSLHTPLRIPNTPFTADFLLRNNSSTASTVTVTYPSARFTLNGVSYSAGTPVELSLDSEWLPITVAATTSGNHAVQCTIDSNAKLDLEVGTWGYEYTYVTEYPIFTGTVDDLNTTYDAENNHATTTLIGVDAVSSLANTNRYGAVVSEGFETFTQRIRRLAASSQVPFELPDVDYTLHNIDNTNWHTFGSTPSGLTTKLEPLGAGIYFESSASSVITQNAYLFGLEKKLTGLKPGTMYRVQAFADSYEPMVYSIGIAGAGWSPPVQVKSSNAYTQLSWEFLASSTEHDLRISVASRIQRSGLIESLSLLGITMYEYDDSFRLQSIVYESSLANHLTLACDSVGAYWYPAKEGTVNFIRGIDGLTKARFVDIPTNEGDISYTDIGLSYATSNVLNDLNVTNHGRDIEGNADDVTHGYRDITSVATWGQRSGDVDMSLYDIGAFAGSIARRAAQIFEVFANRQRIPTHVTFNASADYQLANDLELQDVISVTRDGTEYTCRVVGIEHEIKPQTWSITLELELFK